MSHLVVHCPHCKKKFNYYNSEFRPFCSERCRFVDLGHWLNESYSVPVEKQGDEQSPISEPIPDEEETDV